MTSSTPYLDQPMMGLGDSPQRLALGDSVRLLDMLAQHTGDVLTLAGGLRGDVVHRTATLPVRITEMIGLDVAASVVVMDGSNGAVELRASYMPRRASHTADGHTFWVDEDNYQVTSLGQSLLLPSQHFRVDPEESGMWQTWWACAYPETMGDVVTIEGAHGHLLAGVDFYRTYDRLMFRQHPATLFPDSRMHVTSLERRVSPLSGAAGVEGGDTLVAAVCDIKRKGPTGARLQRVADAYVPTVAMPGSGTVVAKHDLAAGCRYVFQDFEVLVPFEHTESSVGDNVPATHVFGRQVTVADRGLAGENWWRAFDLSGGVSLDSWSPVKGVRMPASPIRATGYEDTDETIRVDLALEGAPARVAAFQLWCRQAERRLPAARHLAPLLGIEAADEIQYVDGLELLFKHLWGRAAILALHTPATSNSLKALLQELCPLQAVLVWVPVV